MRGVDRFRTLPEAEIRILVLVNEFSGTSLRPRELDGRVKLAKLDFLLRYPRYLARVLTGRGASNDEIESINIDQSPFQQRMIRYRYGPWDPSYFATLGSLIGRGLVAAVPVQRGIGYRSTPLGRQVVESVLSDDSWTHVHRNSQLIKRHLDLAGTTLKKLLYEQIPEMTDADWHEELE
ncbi:MAG: hypothetical protein OXH86_13645 [Acidimicrobiaceae bacterium]|nr:hypothetical protein [Acidimicrobiaceae bacterium]